jgi:DNA-directed RNA polymerase subunit N (RpoN/RPB10)
MDSYREYLIRCKTCNSQIACFATQYEDLLSTKLSIEDSLNQMGIRNYCCRIAFMNPTIVTFDMENRALIEGLITIDAAIGPDSRTTGSSQTVFGGPMGTGIVLPQPTIGRNPALPITLGTMVQPVIGANVMAPQSVPRLALLPLQSDQAVPIPKLEEAQTPDTFVEPNVPGIPVINVSTAPIMTMPVGANKQVTVLNGRTYLAR